MRDTLADLGVDSLKTAHLFLAVEAEFGVELPAETAARANTIERLADRLGELLDGPASAGSGAELADDIVRRQQTYLAAWTGRRRTPDSLIFTRGSGEAPPR